MTFEDTQVLDLFDRAVRPIRPDLPDELLAALRRAPSPAVGAASDHTTPVAVDVRSSAPESGRRRRGRSVLALTAACAVLLVGLALMARSRTPEAPLASTPAAGPTGRTSGAITDARNIDFAPWLVDAPAWPPSQPPTYLVFDVAALAGWTQLDSLGAHPIGEGAGYVWSSNVDDPDGREFHLAITSGTAYDTVPSNGAPVDIAGIAGTAGDGEVSWPLDPTHTAVVTEFGTTGVERAVALARRLTTTTVSSISSQLPPGSVADAVPDPSAQFAGSVDGVAWSLSAAPDGMTIVVSGIVKEFRGGGYFPESGIEILEAGNNDHCVVVAAYLPAGVYTPRLVLSDGTAVGLPVRSVDDVADAFGACLPYALDAQRIELVDESGAVAGAHELAAPYLRPTTGGTQRTVRRRTGSRPRAHG